MKNKGYAKFEGGWGGNKVHYGRCASVVLQVLWQT